MLALTELQEIRESLELSQNPLFFFDNDVDGLCSFLILQRALDRGKGVAIKSFPELDHSYIRKVNELKPDAVFILDKPLVNKDFISELEERNIPIIWIDHHEAEINEEVMDKVSYYNTFPSSEPTTYISQNIFNRKEDLWLAMIGCIGDVFMPDFAKQFEIEHPELFNSKISAFDALHSTEIGKFARMLNFGLMDTTTNILKMIKFLKKARGPYDLLEENNKTKQMHKRYSELMRDLNKLLEKAELKKTDGKILFFDYSGKTSMSSELSNNLYFKNKEKIIIVSYKRQDRANISLRGKGVKKAVVKVVKEIENAQGGGHEEACGAVVPIDKLEKFKERISEEIEKNS